MLLAVPSTAALVHRAFALTRDDAAHARALAARIVEVGALAASPEIGGWLSAAKPVSHDRRTPLDPRVDDAVARLHAFTMRWPEMTETRDAAIAAWSSTPRDVWRSAEETVVHRVMRALKLLALDAPAIIVDTELDGLAAAISLLDGPAPRVHAAPTTDPGMYVELAHAIAVHAPVDLSLGTSTDVLARLGASDLSSLSPGELLAPASAMAAREAVADDEERFVLAGLRAWRIGDPASLATAARAFLATLDDASTSQRAKLSKALDRSAPELLRGLDYVASTRTRLEEIAEDAEHAANAGLVLLSELAPAAEI